MGHVTPTARSPLLIAVFVLLVGLCYLHGMYEDYVFDDTVLILKNESIKSVEGLPTILGVDNTKKPSHRVVRNLSYALDHMIWGDDMRGYHITNLLLHVFNAVLVLGISRRVFREDKWAFAAALLWAVHPVHTDSVTYLSGRRDVLSSFFYLWAFHQYLSWRHGERGKLALIGCLVTYVIGCFAKELAVTLPAAVVAYEVVLARRREPDGKHPISTLWRQAREQFASAPVFYSGLALFPVAFTYYVVRAHPYNIGAHYITPRLPTDVLSIAKYGLHYLKLLVWPRDLSMDYFPESLAPSAGVAEPVTLLALALIGALAALTVWAVVRGSHAGLGAAWFVITFLPMSNLLIVSNEPVAEHYLYLPSVGFAWAVVSGLRSLAIRRPERGTLVAAVLGLILLALMFRTDQRNREWDTPESIYKASLEVFPRCSRLWNNLGCYYYRLERWEDGLAAIERAVEISPREALYRYNRGFGWRKQGKLEAAQGEYEAAIKEANDYNDPWIAMAFNLILLKKYDRALAAYDEVLRRMGTEPRRWFYHHWKGVAHREKGDYPGARREFARARELGKDHPETLWQLAMVEQLEARRAAPGAAREKFYAEAVHLLMTAVGKFPESAVLIGVLGDLYREMGQPAKALEAYEGMALANSEYSADAAVRRAKLHRELGQLDRAREAYRTATSLGFKDPELQGYLGASPAPGTSPAPGASPRSR